MKKQEQSSAKFQYRATYPIAITKQLVFDYRNIQLWLNTMSSKGWEFVAFATNDVRSGCETFKQQCWIFRRPL